VGRTKGSKNKPKVALQASENQSGILEVKKESKRAPRPLSGAGNDTPEAPVMAKVDFSRQRAIIDLTTGQIIGPDKSVDLSQPVKHHYSHSFIKQLASCTAQAYFRKTNAPTRPSFALRRGTVVHELIEDYEKEKKDPLAGLPEKWAANILEVKDQMSPEDQIKADKGYAETTQILEEFIAENAKLVSSGRIKPEDVEVPFELNLTFNVGGLIFTRRVVGKIDLVLFNSDRTSYIVLDFKTTRQAPSPDDLARDTQFQIYALAATRIYGFPPKECIYYHLPGTHLCKERFSEKAHPRPLKERKPGCEVNYAIGIKPKTEEEVLDLLNTYYGGNILKWELGIVSKDGLADFKGKCGWCEYREICDLTTSFPPARGVSA
jgi:ATP-dependent exoDNAse (exonuclease V) beta subunit